MRNGGIQIRVSDMIFVVKKRWKLILLLTIVGLILGIAMSGVSYLQGTMSRNFEVTGSVMTVSFGQSGTYVSNSPYVTYDDVRYAEEIIDEVVYLIKSDRTLNAVINDLGLVGITTRDISSNLKVGQYNETQVIELTLTWRSAEEGIDIMNAIIHATRSLIQETMRQGGLSVINSPSTRYLVGGSMNVPFWGYMLVLGFAGGIGIAILELLMRPTLINLKDVESNFGLETLGVIPRNDRYFRRRKSLLVDDNTLASDVVQNYSSTAYILRNRLDVRVKHQCFYVTSATSGEGKTTVAANLAIQLSDMEKRVLLIDFNTHNPSLGGLFLEHVDYYHSLNALYVGEINEEEAITTLTGYLDILPMVLENRAIPMDGTVISLISSLTPKYDYVVIDAPPVGQVSDTLSLNQIVSTVLFVIRYDGPTVQEIQDSLEKLNKSGIRVLGCIVNAAQSLTDTNTGVSEGESRRNSRKTRKSYEKDNGDVAWGTPEKTDTDELLEKRQEQSKQAAEENQKAGTKNNTKNSKKKKKRNLFQRKSKNIELEKTETMLAPAQEVPDTEKKENSEMERNSVEEGESVKRSVAYRNLFEELDEPSSYASSQGTARSDNEIMDELLKLGVRGDWKGEDHD